MSVPLWLGLPMTQELNVKRIDMIEVVTIMFM
jgi:hypothetical protein